MCVFIFLLPEQKKNETKRKFAGSRSEAKNSLLFLNEKNSLRSNSFSFFHGNEGNFLYASPLNAGTYGVGGEDKHRFARWWLICSRVYVTKDKRKNTHSNERSNVASKVRPHFLSVKWKERYGALKRKSCLSEASSFRLGKTSIF